MQNGHSWVSEALLWFASVSSHGGDARVTVVSATVKDPPIVGARVSLEHSIQPDRVATTKTLGRALLDEHYLADSNTRIVIRREGYAAFKVKCPCTGRTYALSPEQQGLDSIRIVLTWHGKVPNLEGHLRYATNHIKDRKGKTADASLDANPNNGRGSLAITIERIRQCGAALILTSTISTADQSLCGITEQSFNEFICETFNENGNTITKIIPKQDSPYATEPDNLPTIIISSNNQKKPNNSLTPQHNQPHTIIIYHSQEQKKYHP